MKVRRLFYVLLFLLPFSLGGLGGWAVASIFSFPPIAGLIVGVGLMALIVVLSILVGRGYERVSRERAPSMTAADMILALGGANQFDLIEQMRKLAEFLEGSRVSGVVLEEHCVYGPTSNSRGPVLTITLSDGRKIGIRIYTHPETGAWVVLPKSSEPVPAPTGSTA